MSLVIGSVFAGSKLTSFKKDISNLNNEIAFVKENVEVLNSVDPALLASIQSEKKELQKIEESCLKNKFQNSSKCIDKLSDLFVKYVVMKKKAFSILKVDKENEINQLKLVFELRKRYLLKKTSLSKKRNRSIASVEESNICIDRNEYKKLKEENRKLKENLLQQKIINK